MTDLIKKQFLDFPGLAEYDKLIKEYIKTGSTDEIDKIVKELADLAIENEARDEAIQANADAIEVLNGDKETEGSVDKKIADAITELVNGAPEALDTLKEIADWIADDESGASTLVSRVNELEQADKDLKEYIDTQDEKYYDSIRRIENVKVNSLFPVAQKEDESVADVIESMAEGSAVKLIANQTIEEDITITKDCYIDANGATFTGIVTVPTDAEVVIENAIFTTPVVLS